MSKDCIIKVKMIFPKSRHLVTRHTSLYKELHTLARMQKQHTIAIAFRHYQ